VTTVIRVFVAVLPLIGLVIGIWLLFVYPLHGKYLQTLQQRVAIMRQQPPGQHSAGARESVPASSD
jgi:Na+/melibiose symporter-like transporter